MPYADPKKAREVKRKSAQKARRTRRAARSATPVNPAPVTLSGVLNVRALLEEQIANVRAAEAFDVIERARAIGFLLQIGLRTIEAYDFETRIEVLERALERSSGSAA